MICMGVTLGGYSAIFFLCKVLAAAGFSLAVLFADFEEDIDHMGQE